MTGDLPAGRDEPRAITERDESPTVVLTLSHHQVDYIVRLANEDGAPGLSELLSAQRLGGLHRRQTLVDRYRSLQEDRRLSRSLLAGLLVLSCFPPGGVELGIKEIAEQLDLGLSTVHRYVATLHAAGLLERDPVTRRYRLTE